jgi:hypothetical protein
VLALAAEKRVSRGGSGRGRRRRRRRRRDEHVSQGCIVSEAQHVQPLNEGHAVDFIFLAVQLRRKRDLE